MAKVQKPSVSPEFAGQRPKKKSPVEDFAGALAIQAGRTLGSNQPARTASAEGQNQKAAIVGAAHGLGRRSPDHSLSPNLEGSLSGKPAEVLAVRSATKGTPAGALPFPPGPTAPVSPSEPAPVGGSKERTAKLPANQLKPEAQSELKPELRPADLSSKDRSATSSLRGERRLQADDNQPLQARHAALESPGSFSTNLAQAAVSPTGAPAAASFASTRLVNATPLTPLQQVASLIVSRSPETPGQVKAEMTLYPENLGTVQVQLAVDASGALSALIVASPDAVAALAPSLSDLRSALQESGLDLSNLDLSSGGSEDRSGDEPLSGSRSVLTLASAEEANNSTAALINGGELMDVIL